MQKSCKGKLVDIASWPVMKAPCASCPIGKVPEIEAVVLNRILDRSQICHHPRLHGKPETHLCRGARNIQLTLFYRLGMIDAPTDQAFQAAAQKAVRKGIHVQGIAPSSQGEELYDSSESAPTGPACSVDHSRSHGK